MILTTEQAAAELGVSPSRVWQMVMRRELEPCRRRAKPLLFRLDDVIELAHGRLTQADRDRLDTLANQWRDSVRDVG